MSVAALVVTRNSGRWIAATLRSIVEQSQAPAEIVVVDDHSTDDTHALIDAATNGSARVVAAASRVPDVTTRIAHNFLQGVRECRAHEIVVLGDHDDIWHADRIARQSALLTADADATMVSSDGRLVDEHGVPLGSTLRTSFPVPGDWQAMSNAARTHVALRHSIATGGASALRSLAFADNPVPSGWLHDRWWSLVATVTGGMRVNPDVVIDYRVSPEQQVGLTTGTQRMSTAARLRSRSAQAPTALRRLHDLHALAARASDDDVRRELSWPRLIGAGLGR